ncbi:hypothetical protein VXM60_09765 [Shewanella khirikhana]|uniref:hypothetical protein n=1 Tax=Shewanella khirikhana TaxID=1965282 RepID=UPI0030D16011
MKPSELSEAIHNDGPMAGKRRLLVGLSMVLIAIYLTGAKVSEASTPFLKISFANVGGLTNLLLLCTGFVLVRYYSYSSVYLQAVSNEWSKKALNDGFFHWYCSENEVEGGYFEDIAPPSVPFNDPHFVHYKDGKRDFYLHPNWFFNAKVEYKTFDNNSGPNKSYAYLASVKHPVKAVWAFVLLLKYWWDAQVRYRESLDIYAPYFIAFTAIGVTTCPILFG